MRSPNNRNSNNQMNGIDEEKYDRLGLVAKKLSNQILEKYDYQPPLDIILLLLLS